jgi:septum formation protein
MESSKLKLILASASPRRRELLGHLKVPFEVLSFDVPEESSATDPGVYSLEIAQTKGVAVFDHCRRTVDGLFVVSADTIVCLGNRIYGKPHDREEARRFLKELAGKTHSVFTAVAVRYARGADLDGFSFVEESKVTFNEIPPALLERYLDTGDSLDKAGAYGIQGPSLTFISRVDGDYANVVGFPLSRFFRETSAFLGSKYPDEKIWLNLFS